VACQNSVLGSKRLAGIAKLLSIYHRTGLIVSNIAPDLAKGWQHEFKLQQFVKFAAMNLRTYRLDRIKQNIAVANVIIKLKDLMVLFPVIANIVVKFF
jgi:hypothetical protein